MTLIQLWVGFCGMLCRSILSWQLKALLSTHKSQSGFCLWASGLLTSSQQAKTCYLKSALALNLEFYTTICFNQSPNK